MFQESYAFLAKGGIIMIPIFLCSIIALALFFERLYFLRKKNIIPQKFTENLLQAISEKQFERAQSLCDQHPSALASIAAHALSFRNNKREIIQEAINDEAKRQNARLERLVPALGAIATVSPLLGLLGTVTGMIEIFGRLAAEFNRGAQTSPGLLANGIWEALLTTAAGLSVAIPVFFLHHYILSKIDKIMLDLEETSTKILNTLSPPP